MKDESDKARGESPHTLRALAKYQTREKHTLMMIYDFNNNRMQIWAAIFYFQASREIIVRILDTDDNCDNQAGEGGQEGGGGAGLAAVTPVLGITEVRAAETCRYWAVLLSSVENNPIR